MNATAAPEQLREALRNSEDNLRLLVDGMRDYAIFMLDPEGKVMSWNHGAERIFGYSEAEVTGCGHDCFYAPEDRESGRPRRELETTLREGRLEEEGWKSRKDGSRFWAHVITTALRDENDKSRGFGVVVRDLTEKKTIEEEVEKSREYIWQSEQRFRTLVDAVQDYAIVMLDTEGRVVSWNAGAQRNTGYAAEEIVGQHFSRFFTEEDVVAGKPQAMLDRAEEEGRVKEDAWRVRKDGSRFFAEISLTPVYDHVGQLCGFAKVTYDGTARRLLEELKVSREQLDTILGNLSDAVMVFDENECMTYCNTRAAELAGFPDRHAPLGRSLSDIREITGVRDENGAPVLYEFARLALTGEAAFRKLIRHRAGDREERWILVNAEPVRDGDGEVAMAVLTAQDVTEVKKAEESARRGQELERQAEKMEAVARLAGGLAHDFNNLLTAINGYVVLVLEGLDSGNPMREPLVEIQRAGERAVALTNQLLVFSRRQVLAPRLMDLNALLSHLEGLLRKLAGEGVEVVLALSEKPARVQADPGQIEHVVMGLVSNARDAMPRGGTLTVQTAALELDSEAAAAKAGLKPGPYVLLSISDTGEGMDAAVAERAFEPFFTTKEPGKAAGLGLSMVFAIVEQSGGKVDVHSEPGLGTTVNVFLPARQGGEPAAGSPETIHPEELRGSEAVLVVEDDEVVLKMISQILRRAGYKVFTARDGEKALKLVSRGDMPDLLLTDLVMPGMSGRQLAEGLTQIRPGMKVVFMSGYARDSIAIQGTLVSQVAFLQKPFSPIRLLQKLREAFAQATA